MRRFYRLVSGIDPPLDDFRSQAELGRTYADPDIQRRAEEVSVWDSLERAMRVASKKPWLGYIAVLDVPMDVPLRRGRRGHWGIPKGVFAEGIRRWVVEVVPVPSTGESSE